MKRIWKYVLIGVLLAIVASYVIGQVAEAIFGNSDGGGLAAFLLGVIAGSAIYNGLKVTYLHRSDR